MTLPPTARLDWGAIEAAAGCCAAAAARGGRVVAYLIGHYPVHASPGRQSHSDAA
jgi:hypothetical protein